MTTITTGWTVNVETREGVDATVAFTRDNGQYVRITYTPEGVFKWARYDGHNLTTDPEVANELLKR